MTSADQCVAQTLDRAWSFTAPHTFHQVPPTSRGRLLALVSNRRSLTRDAGKFGHQPRSFGWRDMAPPLMSNPARRW